MYVGIVYEKGHYDKSNFMVGHEIIKIINLEHTWSC